MASAVDLQDIVDDLSMMFDGMRSFVDRETGEVISVAIADLGAAEEGEEEDVDDAALTIVRNWDGYAQLPEKDEVNKWEIMREFCETVEPPERRAQLLRAIHGRGAFRYFKDLAREFGIIEIGTRSRRMRCGKLRTSGVGITTFRSRIRGACARSRAIQSTPGLPDRPSFKPGAVCLLFRTARLRRCTTCT
jgi:hypothetical protein